MLKQIQSVFSDWQVFGSFQIPGTLETWINTDFEDASIDPSAVTNVFGYKIEQKTIAVSERDIVLDRLFERDNGRMQAMLFMEINTDQQGTLYVSYDADWSALWRLDGKEIFSTRWGNKGRVGLMHHKFMYEISPGRHVLSVRLKEGLEHWRLVLHDFEWKAGVPDELKKSSDASWRNYSRSLMRNENRPIPDGTCGGISMENFETLCMNTGIDARWIAVVHHHKGAYFKNKHIPSWKGIKEDYEVQLKDWVKLLHERRSSVMSWYPMSECEPGWELYPEWRQVYMVAPAEGTSHANRMCCINSPYGEAVIDFCLESIEKFDLDGIWFDGANFSSSHMRPLPVSCLCPSCRKLFRDYSGFDAPESIDWQSPVFRKWVHWRYKMFSDYWLKLESRIHERFPHVSIAFNHYHREGIGWSGAIPLNPFGENFVSASEADGEPMRGAFYSKCLRAYGRLDSEVWISLSCSRMETYRGPFANPRKVIDFAMACATSGAHASTGGGDAAVEIASLRKLHELLGYHRDTFNLPPLPYCAIHMSQQSETFVFGRNPEYCGNWTDYYWKSAVGWHDAIAFSGLPCEVVFDKHIDDGSFVKFPVLVMPFSVALSELQLGSVLSYVREGGTLICGPFWGSCNEEGEKQKRPLLSGLSAFFQAFPDWDILNQRCESELDTGTESLRYRFISTEMKKSVKFSLAMDDSNSINCVNYGKGKILSSAFDIGTFFRDKTIKELSVFVREILEYAAVPPFRISGSDSVMCSAFLAEDSSRIIKIMQFPAAWKEEDSDAVCPKSIWNMRLYLNGIRPLSVKTMVPDESPDLEIEEDSGEFYIKLPPLQWTQIVKIKYR